jgi:hypothetical protein
MFSAYEIWACILAIIGLILTILNIIDKWATLRQRNKAPDYERDRRIGELEKEVARINVKLNSDRRIIEDLQSTNALLVKGILALLEIQEHSDASNTEQIRDIKKEMQHFLITKGLIYEVKSEGEEE